MSLTYQDCIELKEAGFPQGKSIWLYSSDELYQVRMYKGQFFGNELDAPTLEELISAIGRDFDMVRKVYDGSGELKYWMAECTNRTGICCEGFSSIQAVARLYIALHKNDWEIISFGTERK